MQLENKTVLIVSPEPWGKVKISKHHYALALAQLFNKVYFLDGSLRNNKLLIKDCSDHKNIKLITLPAFMGSKFLRFHARQVYFLYLKRIIKANLNKLPKFDFLFSFDCNGVFPDLSLFKAEHTIYFPVDQVPEKFRSDYMGFDYMISVSPVILDVFDFNRQLLIHHGLNNEFLIKFSDIDQGHQMKKPLKFAYVGNLNIGPILDKENIRKVIESHPQHQFHFFGPYQKSNNTLGYNQSNDGNKFIEFLNVCDNCFLHGSKSTRELAEAFGAIDGFIACYKYEYDKNKCSNSHKFMEFLSTGKPIISSRITMFDDLGLFPMLSDFNNDNYLELFENVLSNWKVHNSIQLYEKRTTFAENHTYLKNIERIERFLNGKT